MKRSPYSTDGVALARRTLTDTVWLASIADDMRAEVVRLALDILRWDRAARLGLAPKAAGEGQVIPISRAVFQAGRQICTPVRPLRPRIVVRPIGGPGPGDAA